MNILVVTENYLKGGLETRIKTFYDFLKKSNKIVFAVKNLSDTHDLQDATIYTGFHFSWDSSIEEFVSDVERLAEIIESENIDIVSAHPFYSTFPAVIATQLTNTKLYYTVHGRLSLTLAKNLVDGPFQHFAFEYGFDSIFSVSERYIGYVKNINYEADIHFIPNYVDEVRYTRNRIIYNGRWALISRIDYDKLEEIIKIVSRIKRLNIKILDIYGAGNALDELKNYIVHHELTAKINILNYSDNLNRDLDGKYTGIIATGRGAIEGILMGYPVILCGYGNINGLIDKKLYERAKSVNFVSSEFAEADYDILGRQIEKINAGNVKNYSLRDLAIKDFGRQNIEKLIPIYEEIEHKSLSAYVNFFEQIKIIDSQKDNFYFSVDVFNLLFDMVSKYSHNSYLTEYMSLKREMIEKNRELQNQFDSEFTSYKESLNIAKSDLMQVIDTYRQELEKAHYKIDILSNISLATLIKRDILKVKKRLGKKND